METLLADASPLLSVPDLGAALHRTAKDGFAWLPGALPPTWRRAVLDQIEADRFRPLPSTSGTRVRADQLVVPTSPDGASPVARLVNRLGADVRRCAPVGSGLDGYAPTSGVCLRYRGEEDGIGPHRDGKGYVLLVAVFSLWGTASFSIVSDRTARRIVARRVAQPGDVCLLRGTGLAGVEDGRPWHSVAAPGGNGLRVSLVVRMAGCPARPHPPS